MILERQEEMRHVSIFVTYLLCMPAAGAEITIGRKPTSPVSFLECLMSEVQLVATGIVGMMRVGCGKLVAVVIFGERFLSGPSYQYTGNYW